MLTNVAAARLPLALLALIALILAGCASAGAPATLPSAPVPTESLPTPDPTPSPGTPEVDERMSNACLDCHSDRERLIDTARPEEAEASESSGVG
jgi:hypothetical protein